MHGWLGGYASILSVMPYAISYERATAQTKQSSPDSCTS